MKQVDRYIDRQVDQGCRYVFPVYLFPYLPVSLSPRFTKLALLILFLTATLLATACGASEKSAQASLEKPKTVVVLPAVTPAAVAAKLTPTTNLAAAAQQVATLLSIPQDAVRVRIKLGCIVCEIDNAKDKTSVAGLSVGDAVTQLKPDNDLWLFVQNFTCSYHFDGKTYTPKSCQLALL